MKLSIIVCTYNEIETIEQVLNNIRAIELAGWTREIIVVDNCSTDGTREFLQSIDDDDTTVVYQPENMGKGSSIRTAIEHLTGDYALIHDADLEYDPADHPKFVEAANGGAVAVFGSRTLGGHKRYKYAHAYFGVRVLTSTANTLFGGSLTDIATASKMVKSNVLKSLHLVGRGFDLDFELPAKLLMAGVEIIEVPVNYNPRTYDEGKKIKVTDGLYAFLVMLRDRMGGTRIWRDRNPLAPPVSE